ncbi:bifunctional 3-(3-hydroxy-phenyl)propionate/3-hydroxycinnamic acid hydroxylase [Streptomyces justiciae]|uniref:bifunctional 3-(3-hydroxy-phenyl)propionate/3-hydroxycinnamic acid hydroxylase n=1 Tax=Streptomyces justiciae TaxID=2780140 RepID=UPI002117A615|nr:bifunctional 3-(3-hydroxy-phenyl)propionate/3-hydroxycinnamic acid hydroxylase [Streptomyces justiciae]MCW8379745.1 bifunctional 3-(3-hydroxy-phenyl)propionate/3-hydroxycinnamic acid hydroxylase [Streptomyces justiciae]
MNESFDVAVVGYGPTGMAAAGLLGRYGHRVVVIERWASLYGLPRFTHLDDETLRTLQAICDIDTAIADSTPSHYRWVNGKDEVLLELIPPPTRLCYPTANSIYQPDIEDALDTRLRELPNVEIRQGWILTDLRQGADGVELVVAPWRAREADESGRTTLRAKYVIGADGSNSLVRRKLGVQQIDRGFREQWVNIDAEWLHERPAEFDIAKQYCDPARGHMYMGIGRRRQRFEFAVLDGEDPAELTEPEHVWQWLARTHGLGQSDLRILRHVSYTFEGRQAVPWRRGRVLLAGDAAHVMPPYLGQGACSGIRDAANLSWKLHAILTGRSDDGLLDTYQRERSPHVGALIGMAIELGEIANMRDAAAAEQRDAAFKAGLVPPPVALPPLKDGILQSPPAGPAVGRVAPQGWLVRNGRRERGDEIIGGDFRLVLAPGVHDTFTPAQNRLRALLDVGVLDLGGAIEDLDGVYGAFLKEQNADAVLIRPDHIVFGVASASGAGELLEQLAEMLGVPTTDGESDAFSVHPLHRTWASEPTPIPPGLDPGSRAAALHRAMPFTRLVENGMDPADARELLRVTADGAEWVSAATEIGARQLERAETAARLGRTVTALEAARAALAAFNFAQMSEDRDTDVKRAAYDRYLEAVRAYGRLRGPGFEEVRIPYANGALVGWLSLPDRRADAAVAVWGGLNGWGANYLAMADALNARGIACLLAEGPGQGAPRLHDGIHLRPDTIGGFSKFVDFLLDDPRVGDRVGVWGNSFGGLFAAHTAARDDRVAACVIVSGPAEKVIVRPVPGVADSVLALFGTDSVDEANAYLDTLHFGEGRMALTQPTLVLHGGHDPLQGPRSQELFLAATRDPRSSTVTWPDGEHVIYNHAAERNALVADFFQEILGQQS